MNPRPADYKSAALPTELHQHVNPVVTGFIIMPVLQTSPAGASDESVLRQLTYNIIYDKQLLVNSFFNPSGFSFLNFSDVRRDR